MKIETNWIPTDLANVLGTGFGFTPASTPATNSIDFPSFIGLLAEKNFTDLINNDDIRNKNADYIIGSRLYDSVVDVNGGGDYVSVQEALAAGKKRIFLRSGTYILNSDINIGSDTFIVGEDKYNTIIDLNNTYQILTSGDTEYNTGTITVANDDTTIVGSGTVWTTNLAVNDYIVIYGSVYKITEVTDNTHLEIEIPYRGYPESSISYSAGTFINNIELRNFTITGQDTAITGKASVYLYGIVNSYVANLILKETKLSYGNGVDVRYGFKNIFENIIVDNCGYDGFILIFSDYNLINNITCNNNFYGGFHLNGSNNNICSNIAANSNYSNGIVLQNSSYNQLSNISANSNRSDGVILTTSSNYNTIKNVNSINGYNNGLTLYRSSNNCINGGIMKDNGQQTNDTYMEVKLWRYSGVETHHNIINNLNIECTKANKCAYGIRELSTDDDYNIFTNNIVQGAVTANISTQGSGTLVANNIS